MRVQRVYGYDFHKMHARLRGPSNLFTLHQIIEPAFHSLAYEIAKFRPYMNIKVTAFALSKKFYYIINTDIYV